MTGEQAVDKRRGRQSREREEEFRYRFPKGQGRLQTDDQCPKALSDYLKIN